MEISKENYLLNPCGLLSIPYWKTKRLTLPDNMKILNDNEYNDSYKKEYNDEMYFRLIHDLNNINPVKLSCDYTIGTIDINIQLEDVVKVINSCYKNINVYIEQVIDWTNSEVFDNNLWVYIKEIQTDKIVALGVAEIDREIKEGALEWIQVLPKYQGRGLGQAVVNEILRRMKKTADFVTVSGEVDNKTNPEALYRRCGFTGNDIWHIMIRK